MKGLEKYVWAALAVAALTHATLLYGFPRALMNVVMQLKIFVLQIPEWFVCDCHRR